VASLAYKIATGDVPKTLRDKEFSLNLNAISANAKSPAEVATQLNA
jgi:ATP-dependent Clp protease ATP-binding subunit ClpA